MAGGVPVLIIPIPTITTIYHNTMVSLGATDAILISADVTATDDGAGWLNIVGKVLINGCWGSKSVAIKLLKIGSDFYPPVPNGGETHTCVGSNCSKCSFNKDSHGNVVGCDCLQIADGFGNAATCSHSVTSGSGVDWAGWVGLLLNGIGIWLTH